MTKMTVPLVLTLVALRCTCAMGQPVLVSGGSAADELGKSVAGFCDLDGDGFGDFAAGAPQPAAGPGYVLLLSGGNPSGPPIFVFPGLPNSRFGEAVANCGDVDGDGYDDLLVGAPGIPGSSAGRVSVYSGVTHAHLATVTDSDVGAEFGHFVSGAGDVDADGVPDLLVGAPTSSAGGSLSGRIYVLSGAAAQAAGSSTTANASVVLYARNGVAGDRLGGGVGSVDVNNDGYSDVLLGATHQGAGGALTIVSGEWIRQTHAGQSPQTSQDMRVLSAAAAGDHFGFCAASIGDVDGDLRGDFLVGAAEVDVPTGGGTDCGAITIYSSTQVALPSPTSSLEIRTAFGASPARYFGTSVAALHDWDGDCVPDFAGGAPGGVSNTTGEVRVVSGATGLVLAAFTGAAGAGFGRSIAAIPGRNHLIVGAPSASIGTLTNAGQVAIFHRCPATYPGTCDDLVLETGVNGPPIPCPDVKVAHGGDFVTLTLRSPNGALAGPAGAANPYIGVQLFSTGGLPPASSSNSWLHLDPATGAVFLFDGSQCPILPCYLPLAGMSFGFQLPTQLQSLLGQSLMIQGFVSSVHARNGRFAATDGQVIQFQ